MSILLCMTVLTACGTKKVNDAAAVNDTTVVEGSTGAEESRTVEETTTAKEATSANADKSQTKVNPVVQVSNTVAAQSDETINANLQNMKTIFRALSGYIIEEKSYDISSDAQYWKALVMATNEYVRDYGKEDFDGNHLNNYYKVSPEIIREMAYVLFPDRTDFQSVDIPQFTGVPYITYDKASNAYHVNIGELGIMRVSVGDFVRNEDGSITVSVNAFSPLPDDNLNETISFTLINNEDDANSDFAYAVKGAKVND